MTNALIRPAMIEDAPTIHRLLSALAHYQHQGDIFTATVDDVRRDGFGAERRYESWLAEWRGEAVGLATGFQSYSTFRGQPLWYLDNLYVMESTRGMGLGKQLLTVVAQRAQQLGCCRLELKVLDWNPTRHFYEGLGLVASSDISYEWPATALEQWLGNSSNTNQ